MLTPEQLMQALRLREACGLPPEGIRTPRSPRDDERDPASWLRSTPPQKEEDTNTVIFAPYCHIHTRELLYERIP